MKKVYLIALLLSVINATLSTSVNSGGHPSSYHYFRTNNFDQATETPVSAICQDRCDVSGLCTNKQTCAQLTAKYSCSEYYAPGKAYAGWCDSTCGFCKAPLYETQAVKARRVSWNSTYSIWDSPRAVHVSRFDLFGATQDQRIGGEKAVFRLKEGAAYFFTTSPLVTLKDVASGKQSAFYSESVAWVSKGACLEINMAYPNSTDSNSNVSLIVVSSGVAEFEVAQEKDCVAGAMRVGYDELHNNPVDYEMNGACNNVLNGPGGATDFDDLDMPIRPLMKHYHSRGALYYVASGSSVMDEGVAGILPGELRFVQQGYYYGPETMSDGSYVMSFHEPDPSARSTSNKTAPAGYNPCAFACLDDPSTSGLETMACRAPSVEKLAMV